MHLDSTFDALSNGSNYKFKFHQLVGDFGEKSSEARDDAQYKEQCQVDRRQHQRQIVFISL